MRWSVVVMVSLMVSLISGCKGMKGFGSGLGHVGRAATRVGTSAVRSPDWGSVERGLVHATADVIRASATAASFDTIVDSDDDDEEDAAETRTAVETLESAPPALERPVIAQALEDVVPQIAQCSATRNGARVVVSVTVMPAGTVDRVIVRESPTAPLGDCVAGALKVALFPMTQRGGSFTYPFVF